MRRNRFLLLHARVVYLQAALRPAHWGFPGHHFAAGIGYPFRRFVNKQVIQAAFTDFFLFFPASLASAQLVSFVRTNMNILRARRGFHGIIPEVGQQVVRAVLQGAKLEV
ncbi:hypothetical protein D3C86_1808880 [compost metagenome]